MEKLVFVTLCVCASTAAGLKRQGVEQSRSHAEDMSLATARDTPVTRVVKLLEEMAKTLQKDMDEDENLYKQLACWCNNNEYDKIQAIEAGETKIADLKSTIESKAARSAELKTRIKELETQVAEDKAALAEATALREKQLKEFHGMELDDVQALENIKAALEVLSKHHQPESTNWFAGQDEAAKETNWKAAFSQLRGSDSIEQFAASGLSSKDRDIVQKALKAGERFMQTHQGYYPSYSSQSGQIVGILKQMMEEMGGDLAEAQKQEKERAAAFAELRAAKTSEIESGEKMAEKAEDELANTDNDLAEAKEDLGQEETALAENQKFLKNLKETCADADSNFEERKKVRLEEIKAVADTITILTQDMARDAMSGTYQNTVGLEAKDSFMQISLTNQKSARTKAAAALRRAALMSKNPELSMLASSVELDAFTKVKKAIDDMIATLGTQQADEVKKNDYCKSELQQNEMTNAKTEDYKADLEAKEAELEQHIKTLMQEIEDATAQIAQMQVDLQRASEDRVKENHDFQKTIADQTATIEVLHKALDRLATFYDKESLLQKSRQTPPVPQMEYKASAGSTGVMSMIEKLIYEAKGLMAESRKAEGEAQTAYETTVADTNGSVAALQKEVVTKNKQKAQATKEKQQTVDDIMNTVDELEDLAKTNARLHAECDYLLKNFMARQEARVQEIEALQQAKQILNGASLA